MNLAELVLVHAYHNPDRIAVRKGAQSMTYGELKAESDRVAVGLRERGVRRGDRVMMFSENTAEFLVSYNAVARLGAIFVPVHPSFQTDELDYVLANATPQAVIAEPDLLARLVRSESPHLPAIQIVLGPGIGNVTRYDRLGRDTSATVGIEDMAADDPVLICYTSGTTDRPNPVTRSHDHEIWNAQTYSDVNDYRADDIALVTMPLSWVWGLSTTCQGLLSVGAAVVLHTEFEAGATLDEIEHSGITLFAGTMSMFTAMLSALNERPRDLASLRRLYRGGEPRNNEVARHFEVLTGLPLNDAYATTEAAPILAVDPVRDPTPPMGTAGRLVPGARIRLVDEYGTDVPIGEVGEAWLGGRGIMLGYWNEPALTADRLTSDGWFRSGDLMIQDSAGYYFVVGRSGDVIIRNGAKIAPAEIESALTSLPGVRDAVAVGVPDEEFGESIATFVVLDPGCIVSVDDVYAQLSDRIARFKLPGDIRFVEELPLRRNEKRDRKYLRQYAFDVIHGSAAVSDASAAEPDPAHLRIFD
jgi:long-chain acyl-CoA synthetase